MFRYVKYKKVETPHTTLEFRGGNEEVQVTCFDGFVAIKSDSEDAINALINSQDDTIECEEITQDEFKALFVTTSRFVRIKQRVEESFDKDMSALTDLYPAKERETWQIQLIQAKTYKESGDEADAPFLKILADAEDTTVDDFADAVIQKAKAYEGFAANILAKKRAYEKELLSEVGL